MVLYFTTGGAQFTLTAEYAFRNMANVTFDATRASSRVTIFSRVTNRHFLIDGALFTARQIVFSSTTSATTSTNSDRGGSLSIARSSSRVLLDQCTFSNNRIRSTCCYDGFGAAIYASYATLTISNCIFSGNTLSPYWSAQGGAVHSSYATVTITASQFMDNSVVGSDTWGGAFFSYSGVVTLSGCTFLRNTAGARSTAQGGAVYIDTAGARIIDSSFTANYAKTIGGAIYSQSAWSLTNAYFEGNTNSFTPQDDVYNTASATMTACSSSSDIVLESRTSTPCPVSILDPRSLCQNGESNGACVRLLAADHLQMRELPRPGEICRHGWRVFERPLGGLGRRQLQACGALVHDRGGFVHAVKCLHLPVSSQCHARCLQGDTGGHPFQAKLYSSLHHLRWLDGLRRSEHPIHDRGWLFLALLRGFYTHERRVGDSGLLHVPWQHRAGVERSWRWCHLHSAGGGPTRNLLQLHQQHRLRTLQPLGGLGCRGCGVPLLGDSHSSVLHLFRQSGPQQWSGDSRAGWSALRGRHYGLRM
jgi:predicted outer membrane repeat protein